MSQGQERRRQAIEAALKDAELLATISPIVAAGFGVLPIERQGAVLTVACFAHAKPAVLRALGRLLRRDVIASPFEDQLLRKAIGDAYFPQDESLNFPTFLEPDFLEDARSIQELEREKLERFAEPRCSLAPESLVLASLVYRTRLLSLDDGRHPRGLVVKQRRKIELRDDPLPFSRDASGALAVHTGDEKPVLPAATAAYLRELRASDFHNFAPGSVYSEHVLRATAVARDGLPHVVHASEVQLIRIEEDGRLVFHAYDREVTTPPGKRTAFELTYYFLSYGSRLRREITVLATDVTVLPRTSVPVRSGPAPWGKEELALWLGIA